MTSETIPAIAVPPVPLTVDGASLLHQMMRIRWTAWRALPAAERSAIVAEAAEALGPMEQPDNGRQSAIFSLLGHKGDLLLVHFRRSFEELNEAERAVSRLRLSDFLEPTHSYLSIVELGLYESTSKTYAGLAERGVEPHSEEWNREIGIVLERQRAAMAPGSGRKFRPQSISLFIPWTAVAASRPTGTPFPCLSASA